MKIKFCIWLFFEYARSYNSIPFIWENFETSPYGKLRHSCPPQSRVRSHFLWSKITHDTFAKLWSAITHDHFLKILNDQITIMICDHFADHAPLMSNYTEGRFPVEGAIYSESSWPRNVTNSEVKSFWNKFTEEDYEKPLDMLGLCPSAVIRIF